MQVQCIGLIFFIFICFILFPYFFITNNYMNSMKLSQIFILECRAGANISLQTTLRVERCNSDLFGEMFLSRAGRDMKMAQISMLRYLFCNIENKAWYQPITQAVTLHSQQGQFSGIQRGSQGKTRVWSLFLI